MSIDAMHQGPARGPRTWPPGVRKRALGASPTRTRSTWLLRFHGLGYAVPRLRRRGDRGDLHELRRAERFWAQVLPRVRSAPRGRVRHLRRREPGGREVLWRVRGPVGRRGRRCSARRGPVTTRGRAPGPWRSSPSAASSRSSSPTWSASPRSRRTATPRRSATCSRATSSWRGASWSATAARSRSSSATQ